MEVVSRLIKNDGGQMIMLGISRDISDRYEMKQELQFRYEIMESLLANSPNLMSFIDDQGHFSMVSETFARTFSLTQEEMNGFKALSINYDSRI